MRTWLRVGVILTGLLITSAAPLAGQDKGPPPEKVEKTEPAPPPARDGSAMLVHYLLAAIATILIMVLICMPIRRE